MFFLYESDSDFDDASSSFDEYDFPSSTRGKYEEVLVGNVSNSHSDDSSEWDGPIIEELPSDSAADSEEQDTKATNWARSPSAEGRGAPENSTEKDESANAQTKLETERQSKKGKEVNKKQKDRKGKAEASKVQAMMKEKKIRNSEGVCGDSAAVAATKRQKLEEAERNEIKKVKGVNNGSQNEEKTDSGACSELNKADEVEDDETNTDEDNDSEEEEEEGNHDNYESEGGDEQDEHIDQGVNNKDKLLPPEQDPARTVYFGKLPEGADERSIRNFFVHAGCAPIRNITFPCFHDTDKPMGCALVQFESEDSVRKALKLNKSSFLGIPMKVNLAQEGKPNKDDKRNHHKTVHVSNLSYKATVEDIKKFFKQCGTVVRCNLPRWRGPRSRLRGFAMVEFRGKEEVEEALKLSGTVLLGREVRIQKLQGQFKKGRYGSKKRLASGRGQLNGSKRHKTDKNVT